MYTLIVVMTIFGQPETLINVLAFPEPDVASCRAHGVTLQQSNIPNAKIVSTECKTARPEILLAAIEHAAYDRGCAVLSQTESVLTLSCEK